METYVWTLTVSAKTRDLLKKLAKETQRSETVLVTEAIERYVEVENWHLKKLNKP
jgi:predicted transcriptional regulator